MISATTNRIINLLQLGRELASRLDLPDFPGLSSEATADETVVHCHHDDVTQEDLDAVIEEHIPEPPPPTAEELLQQQLDELTDLVLGGM